MREGGRKGVGECEGEGGREWRGCEVEADIEM